MFYQNKKVVCRIFSIPEMYPQFWNEPYNAHAMLLVPKLMQAKYLHVLGWPSASQPIVWLYH